MHEYDYDVTQNDNAYQTGKRDALKEFGGWFHKHIHAHDRGEVVWYAEVERAFRAGNIPRCNCCQGEMPKEV